ncbi:L-glutamate gamma-semialdehyde dehydrogenase [Alphaproteobacteria bacterium]|nr:L-glutamate gamma-semialdehyde dehydrogenase [Alphaproteobacteria bacterium]
MNAPKDLSSTVSWGQNLFPELGAIADEQMLVSGFYRNPPVGIEDREEILLKARKIVASARQTSAMMSAEKIMAVYKLSTAEGRMIMELAEALLRVPDATTRDFLIFDKLAPGHWLDGDAKGFLLGMESALALAGGIVRHKHDDGLKTIVSRLGVPTVRRAIETAMRQMGGQFVFAETIERATKKAANAKTLFSFDMLGEAARSAEDCERYFNAYAKAINVVGAHAKNDDVNQNSGVSVKLSALSCRFQPRYWPTSHKKLLSQMTSLAIQARRHNIPLTIDAEEFGRLKPSLYVFEQLLAHSELNGWAGLGMVVQAYSRYAGAVIDWLEAKANEYQTRVSIRLVKGAYWDTEIKIAQEKGLADFPVYTAKNHTDLAYLTHTKRLMEASHFIHPQFASHNAYTLTAVAHLAETHKPQSFELQKLHGMGDDVHRQVGKITSAPLRVYAPVGHHNDLLAYLVRRILENGASSSFMNQFADEAIAIENLVSDPFAKPITKTNLPTGEQIFASERKNSCGFDDTDIDTLREFAINVLSHKLPARPGDASLQDVSTAFEHAQNSTWTKLDSIKRASILDRIADHYEQASGSIYHLLVHEAGKTIDDAAGELREAIDFCRYYAAEARQLNSASKPRGIVVAISPWNFPLAIFTGQIVAALGAGNIVIAKPAEQTPRIAALAASLMHEAGIPKDALQLLCGDGAVVGAELIAAGQADMVVFTGSTETAKLIELAIAHSAKPSIPLIAETGGLNAMIVDSSALMERAVDDILDSAFRSAGQRCSALRILYAQEDIADKLIQMLIEAALVLKLGDPAEPDTDIGPVIDQAAKTQIDDYVEMARSEKRLIWQGIAPENKCFIPPSLIKVTGIGDLEAEIFGPVLHIATYKAGHEASVVNAINMTGYGLTFGMHSRIDANIEMVSKTINVGNVYINRNQIGAVVGSQPFGGHGLSGTGPKAGGSLYLHAFLKKTRIKSGLTPAPVDLPGPSGERNSYKVTQRGGKVLILHEDSKIRQSLADIATSFGNEVVIAEAIPENFDDIDVVMTQVGNNDDISVLRKALFETGKRIIPLITTEGDYVWLRTEKHICRDMTASGGNIDLLMN